MMNLLKKVNLLSVLIEYDDNTYAV